MNPFGNIVGADEALWRQLSGDAPQGGAVQADDLPGGFAGVTPTSVTTLSTANIAIPLNAVMRTDRLVLGAAACVDLCRVVDLKVGTVSLNVGQQPACAVAFKHDAVGTRLRGAVTSNPSIPPILVFYNGTGGTIVVEGAMFGPVMRAN
jgi:hypothetical protein